MGHPVETRTYVRHECVVFRKTREEFGGLSNMAAGFPLKINGVHIRTSEALYQACRFPHKPDVQRLIINQRSPMTAKMKGKPHRAESRADWDHILTRIMRWCLRVKLAQNWERFSTLLLATGDRPIVEESRKDAFWGAKPVDGDELAGANVLGRLLLEMREDLRRGEIEKLRHVEPPDVPGLLLFGQPIGTVEASGDVAAPVSVAVAVEGGFHQDFPLQPFGSSTPASDEAREPAVPSSMSEERPQVKEVSSIPKECKRLAEVDFPIAVVSGHGANEKYSSKGYPNTLHMWWARRPYGTCRAVLMALLLPDPCDQNCPEEFKYRARELLPRTHGPVGPKEEDLRAKLLRFIGDFSNWGLSTNPTWLSVARGLVKAAHPEEPPLVVDPFAGGGSIPLEALRVGCEAFASDLNPVACLILKVMLEDVPRHGPALAEELRWVGREIKDAAKEKLDQYYPADSESEQPIVYLWARTVSCEAPSCGAEIPLVRSCWLARKEIWKRERGQRVRVRGRQALRYRVEHSTGQAPSLIFEIFEPDTSSEVQSGTVTRARAKCPCCGTVLPPDRLRTQLSAQRGGADSIFDKAGVRIGGARILAVVVLRSGEKGRLFRLPNDRDYVAVWKAGEALKKLSMTTLPGGLPIVPEEPLAKERARGNSGFRVLLYGMPRFSDLFTVRQKLSLVSLMRLLVDCKVREELRELLGMAFSRVVMSDMSLTRWNAHAEKMQHTFGRQALPMVWDFAEIVPLAEAPGNWQSGYNLVSDVIETWLPDSTVAQVQIADASSSPLPDEVATIWFTDPPYYDAIHYADLSDFFFVWLKRLLPTHPLLHDPFNTENPVTPKSLEIVEDKAKSFEGRPKDGRFFEDRMARSFAEGCRVLQHNGVGCVVFAHKTTEGWEALLSGLIGGGLVVTASWPIETESRTRLVAMDTAALTTSIHLVCRPRPDDASIGDWADVLRELPNRVGDWMERLQAEGVRGADLVFACIGPALEIFSQHSKVETAEGREVGLPEYLEKVWEVVGRAALEQVLGTAESKAHNGLAGALEEDARLTALFLWTLQSTNGSAASNGADASTEVDDEDEAPRGKPKGYSLIFDVVRRFAKPLGIHLPDWESRIIEIKKGVVRLLPVAERAKQLFGESRAGAIADEIEYSPAAAAQMSLFPEQAPANRGRGRRRAGVVGSPTASFKTSTEATTLDRVHAAILLQSSGRSQALRNLLKAEQERSPNFLRLANALSALYPRGSEEKRLLDAMLLAVPR